MLVHDEHALANEIVESAEANRKVQTQLWNCMFDWVVTFHICA